MNVTHQIAHDTSITRIAHSAKVPREEIQALVNQLTAAGFTRSQIADMAGFTQTGLTDATTKRAKMALIGVIASLGDKPNGPANGWQPAFEECALIFEAANRLLAASHPGPRQDAIKRLLARAAITMSREVKT